MPPLPDVPIFVKIFFVLAAIYAVLALVYGPRRARAMWMRFGQAIGDFLARLVMTLFYFSIFVPFALIARRQDPLGLRRAEGALWQPVPEAPPSLETARRQH